MKRKSITLVLVVIFTLITLAACAAPAKLTPAPPFTLTDNKGSQISLSDFKGQKAVLLIFFNYQVGGGQDPVFQSYLAYYQGTNRLQVLQIINRGNLPNEMRQAMAGMAQQNPQGLGLATPLRDEDGSVSAAYGVSPDKLTIVLVDREGNIRFRQEVTSTADTNTELVNQVKDLTR
jgi:hypothetical protein